MPSIPDWPPERKALLGGDFDPEDTSWPAICAHALAVARWLEDLRARRARDAAADGDGIVTPTIAPEPEKV
jgi:hypothetical protein